MGYCTRFSLDWSGAKDDAQEDTIRDFVRTSEEAQYCLGDDAKSSEESGKWYDWKDDLKTWSVQFPHVLFTMKGNGEESGDIWIAYAKAGVIQHERAVITLAPCKL